MEDQPGSPTAAQEAARQVRAAWRLPRLYWWRLAKAVAREQSKDRLTLLAAGVAFYGFVALFPALISVVMIYGLVADPEVIAEQTRKVSHALPSDAASVLNDQLTTLIHTSPDSLSVGLVVAAVVALWSASTGVGHLVMAINTAHDTAENRGFVHRKALALSLTVGAIVFVVLAIGLVAVTPAVLNAVVPEGPLRVGLQVVRWLGIVVTLVVALAVLYRLAPAEHRPGLGWVSVGTVVATVIWLGASVGFSFFVDNFGRYANTYGTLAGVVVLLLWMWLTAFAVLLGAEVNEQVQLLRAELGPTSSTDG